MIQIIYLAFSTIGLNSCCFILISEFDTFFSNSLLLFIPLSLINLNCAKESNVVWLHKKDQHVVYTIRLSKHTVNQLFKLIVLMRGLIRLIILFLCQRCLDVPRKESCRHHQVHSHLISLNFLFDMIFQRALISIQVTICLSSHDRKDQVTTTERKLISYKEEINLGNG